MVKGFSPKTVPRDVFTGIIIALVSIPISMGYSQVAGLPPVYGLYGSIFPIPIYGLFSTSPGFIFGVDAAPAALVGAFLADAGIAAGSPEAVSAVPMVSLFVGLWLLLFYFLKAGKLVSYISTPVMGGFISGISTTIIFMQIPKILGGTSGAGEILELVAHIVKTCRESFNGVSFILGGVSLIVLVLSKKIAPKLPMSVFVMAGGALLGWTGFAESHGVAQLSSISPGLPEWSFPHITMSLTADAAGASLTIAVVIMAETLLASGNLASKNGDKLDSNREILVYSMGNFAASMVGCCPVNGSVSRSAMGEQYGGKSQVMSIAASVTMMLILLFFTGFIGFLPVPVLTAIVISALMGAVETHLAKRLFAQDKREFLIFMGAFSGVLLFGTVYGVLIGVVLSFVSVIINTANPKRSFLGVIPGHEGFHSLERNSNALPVQGAVIYRFSGNLYFANISTFVDEVESSVGEGTKCVIIDSGAICGIDVTSADRIAALRKSLKDRKIELYFASHIGSLNDRFRELGIGDMVEQGYCRRTIPAALSAAGIGYPYVLEGNVSSETAPLTAGNRNRLEFEWAFGERADEVMERYAQKLLENIDPADDPSKQLEVILHTDNLWTDIGVLDQEELLDHLQTHRTELSEKLNLAPTAIDEAIENRKLKLAQRLEKSDPRAFRSLREHTKRFESILKKRNPERYDEFIRRRNEATEHLSRIHPEYRELIHDLYGEDGEK